MIHQETSQRRPAWPHRSLIHLPRDDSTLVSCFRLNKRWVSWPIWKYEKIGIYKLLLTDLGQISERIHCSVDSLLVLGPTCLGPFWTSGSKMSVTCLVTILATWEIPKTSEKDNSSQPYQMPDEMWRDWGYRISRSRQLSSYFTNLDFPVPCCAIWKGTLILPDLLKGKYIVSSHP